MTSTEQQRVEEIAKGLTKAQRAMVLAGSGARYKRWSAIRRHAKVAREHRAGTLWMLFEHDREKWWLGFRLSGLGLAVRTHLQGQAS